MEDKEVYLNYFKVGNLDYFLNVIVKVGVDMISVDYLDVVFRVFEECLVELENFVVKGVYND